MTKVDLETGSGLEGQQGEPPILYDLHTPKGRLEYSASVALAVWRNRRKGRTLRNQFRHTGSANLGVMQLGLLTRVKQVTMPVTVSNGE